MDRSAKKYYVYVYTYIYIYSTYVRSYLHTYRHLFLYFFVGIHIHKPPGSASQLHRFGEPQVPCWWCPSAWLLPWRFVVAAWPLAPAIAFARRIHGQPGDPPNGLGFLRENPMKMDDWGWLYGNPHMGPSWIMMMNRAMAVPENWLSFSFHEQCSLRRRSTKKMDYMLNWRVIFYWGKWWQTIGFWGFCWFSDQAT